MGNNIVVRTVRSGADFKAFLRLPWRIYRNDRNWVPPIERDIRDRLDKKKNPFFEHADREIFLALRDGEAVGRIVAVLDENHNSFHEEKIVFFGLYESLNDPEIARALLEAAAAWGRERGMDTLRGPVNLSLNEECAFLLEGFDSPPVIMMPYNPPFYLNLMEDCGLVKAMDLYAYLITKDVVLPPKIQGLLRDMRENSTITVRPINMRKLKDEAEKIKYIYNNAWEKNWGFVLWTGKEMDHMIRNLKSLADPNIILIAEDKGRPVGFGFGFPNYNEILIKLNGKLTPWNMARILLARRKIRSMRAPVFGILKEYRLSGLSYLLFDEIVRRGKARGYEWCEMSWMLENNDAINRFSRSVGAKVYKEYRIYQKSIA
ncbi:MAG: hypothetical protein JW747_09235 [Candidatus Aminicenantes bacterium]|nr:hypothetical protein [Candidatus Aminicenantes bacterium]